MIEIFFYAVFLSGLAAFTGFLLRQKTAYFKCIKISLALAFISFGAMVACDMVKNLAVKSAPELIWVTTYTSLLGISFILITSLFLEYAALKLYSEKCKIEASKRLQVVSMVFKGYTVGLLALALIFKPWHVTLAEYIWGGQVWTPSYDPWYVSALAVFTVFFFAYPCSLFALSGKAHKEPSVRIVFYWLGICWGFISVCLVIFNGYLRWLGVETVEAGYMINGMHFIVLAYFFMKTNMLQSFFELTSKQFSVNEGEHLVLFYTSAVDKAKIFAAYIQEGVRTGDRIIYVYPDGEREILRGKLEEHGINVEELEKSSALYLMSLSEAYLNKGEFNKEWLINFWSELKNKTREMGFKHERDLFDLGSLNALRGHENEYFDYLREANKQLMDPFLIELRAVDVENLDKKWVLEFKFLTTKSMDLLAHLDRFSRKIGLTHMQIEGKKVLLEFDPTADYERQIQDFVTEALANTEPVVVFTSKGSSVHNFLKSREGIKFLLLTPAISSPQIDSSTNDILLPANNTSLILDALDKTIKANPQSNIDIVFDNLSNLVFSVGFEKVHSFINYAFEILSSGKVAAVFLFNPSAHDDKVKSGIRSLFDTQIIYAREGLSVIKMSESELLMKPWSVP